MKGNRPLIGAFLAVSLGLTSYRARADETQDLANACTTYKQLAPQMALLHGMELALEGAKLSGKEKLEVKAKIDAQEADYRLTMTVSIFEYLMTSTRKTSAELLADKTTKSRITQVAVVLANDPKRCPVDMPSGLSSQRRQDLLPFSFLALK